MRVHTFERALVAVTDLAEAEARYTALLGRAPARWSVDPESGTASARYVFPNGGVELLCPTGPGPLSDRIGAHLTAEGEGLCGLTLGGADLAGPVVALPQERTRGLWVLLTEADEPASSPPPEEPPPGVVHALDHLVIATADPEGAIACYGRHLGLRLALDRTFPERGLRLIFFRFGGMTLEVSALLGADPGTGSPDRFHGLAYRVAAADAAHARLAAAGFTLSAVRAGHKPGTRVFTVREGTCGVPTLIIEDPSRAATRRAPRPEEP